MSSGNLWDLETILKAKITLKEKILQSDKYIQLYRDSRIETTYFYRLGGPSKLAAQWKRKGIFY